VRRPRQGEGEHDEHDQRDHDHPGDPVTGAENERQPQHDQPADGQLRGVGHEEVPPEHPEAGDAPPATDRHPPDDTERCDVVTWTDGTAGTGGVAGTDGTAWTGGTAGVAGGDGGDGTTGVTVHDGISADSIAGPVTAGTASVGPATRRSVAVATATAAR